MTESVMTNEIRAMLYRATELAFEDDQTDEQLRDIAFLLTFSLVKLKETTRGRIAVDRVTADALAEQAKRIAARSSSTAEKP